MPLTEKKLTNSYLQAIVQRFEAEIKPQTDRIMSVLLQVLSTVGAKSSVPDVIFATVGAVASALEDEFVKYMEPFKPFLYNALSNQEEPGLCAMAIGLVSDIARALNEKVQPHCDDFMNLLLGILRTSTNQLKPAILETFGDIAQAIGTNFSTYLVVVGGVLQQASSVTTSSDLPFDMVDYIVSLREGIMDAWGGILLSYKGKPQSMSSAFLFVVDRIILMKPQSMSSSPSSSLFSSCSTSSPRRVTAVRVSCDPLWVSLGTFLLLYLS